MPPKLQNRKANIGILLRPKFSFSELGLVIEPLFITNWLLEEKRYNWQLLSMDGGDIQASNGLSLKTDPVPVTTDGYDGLFVLASFEMKTLNRDDRPGDWLRQAACNRRMICGIEGGSEVLAAAGLLDGYRAAIHWDNYDGFCELYPEVEASLDLYVMDGHRMTCAGGTAVVDFMFHWLAPQLGNTICGRLQEHMIENRARTGSRSQIQPGNQTGEKNHPLVRQALEIMRESIENPVAISEIAKDLGISVRQLERRFVAELHTSPSKHYLYMRITRAHRLLQQTNMPVAEVAAGSGFQSLEHFSRTYRQYYGCPPSQDRLQTIQAPSLARLR
jgi:AraC family carnitine catabolism transcriptional activator